MPPESMTPIEFQEEALRLHRAGRTAEAEAAYLKVLESEPDRADVFGHLSVLSIEKGETAEAEVRARKAVELDPSSPHAWNNLGAVMACKGDLPSAAEIWRKALELDPASVDAHANLGKALRGLGKMDEAKVHLQKALEAAPDRAVPLADLVEILLAEGKDAEAVDLLGKHAGTDPGAWLILGDLQARRGEWASAEKAYRGLLRLSPHHPEGHLGLASLYFAAGSPAEAFDAAERALYAHPEHSRAYAMVGRALSALGRVEEAVDAYAFAANHDANRPVHHHRFLSLLRRDRRQTEASLAEAHVTWGRLASQAAAGRLGPVEILDRDPARKLKVGYLSADFARTPGSHVLGAILLSHDPAVVEVFGYSDVPVPDETTGALAARCAHFRNLAGLDDLAVAKLIRQDGVDILVDLAGHLSGGRVDALAFGPAPVQVAAAGYGCTHGLAAITHRLTDATSDPLGAEAFGPESILRLDRPAFAYAPFPEAPVPGPLPALSNGFLSLGYFGPLDRLQDDLLETWALLLSRLPGARLSLPELPSDPRTRSAWLSRIEQAGLDLDRIGFRPAQGSLQDHLAAYSHVDLALAEFPHPSAAAMCEALWMGLPVLGVERRALAFRPGLGVLGPLGFPEWMPPSAEALAAQAVKLGSDLGALAELRSKLRGLMAASPLLDAAGLARALESAYRTLWSSALS